MALRFNPLNHPLLYTTPLRVTPFSAWHQHIPFAMVLIDIARPRTVVELGTHAGDSYCAFCQATAAIGIKARCTAVDTWAGDSQSGAYGPELLANLQAHHDPLYGDFSTLKQSTFDAALSEFADGSIDLLHIDGCHTYEAVKHDFEGWLPKLSSRGLALFHDTAVVGFGFGVKTFWNEVMTRYPNFEFLHGHGLGVLAVGPDQPEPIREMLTASDTEADNLRGLFTNLGQRLELTVEVERLETRIQEMQHSIGWRILRRLDRLSIRLIPRPN